MTVADLLRRYQEEVTPSKRGARDEKARIKLNRSGFVGCHFV